MNEKIGDIDIGNEYRDSRGIMGNCLTISGLSGQEAAESFMNGITENGNLDFNKIIPLKEKCETEREKNWGSKYNATDTQIQAEEKEQIKIMFNTSFVVFGIVKALSEKFPALDIVYEYSDEFANCSGISEWRGGKEYEGCDYPYKTEESLSVFRMIWGRFPDFDCDEHIRQGEKKPAELE